MPKSVLDWKVRRKLSENPKTSREVLTKTARLLMEADRPVEALDFLAKSGDKELAREIKALAIKEGNIFIYVRACLAAKESGIADEIKRLADNASAAGLDSYAEKAYEMLLNASNPPNQPKAS